MSFMLGATINYIMLSVIMLSVIMLSVIMLSVIMMSVVLLNAVAPHKLQLTVTVTNYIILCNDLVMF